MTDRPKKHFTLAHDDGKRATRDDPLARDDVRDKDNVESRPPPPEQIRFPHPKLAPGGFLGIKRNLPVPGQQKARPNDVKAQGDLLRVFKPLVSGKCKERGHDR